MKDVYRFDFDATDFGRGVGVGSAIVVAPILPSEFPSVIERAGEESAIASLIFRVVALAPGAAMAIPGLAIGDTVIARNLAGYTASARMKFLLLEPQDILWRWPDGAL